ncbi:MAG TPA: methyltransferase domain-containing protein [Pyrinomonadaceae bacterium]|jgi:2-polyprenyl-3-methyl-5-hydroxy-6-metoxy-1,4-benzoquinol methylase|nr:methyltransferase domain-containing protein [Pyrinomonadaceae bacterium]
MNRKISIKSFGFIWPGEGLELALRVLGGLRAEYQFSYCMVGKSSDWTSVRELVVHYGLTECLTIEEDSSPEELRRHLAATDIALCLHEAAIRAPLFPHDPSMNEGHLYHIMSAGVPAVVFDRDWPASLPSETVVKIDEDQYAEKLLRAYLEKLMTDAGLRERIGANAQAHVQTQSASAHPAMNNGPVSGLVRESNGRFQKIEGLDYRRGAILYPERLDANNRHHLLTKPFYNLAHKISRWEGEGMDEDTRRQFCDFANMAVTLALPTGSRILDVGCGSGWLSEYFARLGYDVTGIDISPALIEMARERLQNVPYGVDRETPLRYRFLAHDIESALLDETFDAIICYDALHHFEDERAVLRNLAAMLEDGGTLFVLEGERPPAGSATEKELRGVMMEYETLESPFSRDYLRALLVQHGFAITGDYVSVNGLFEREMMNGEQRLLVQPEQVNYLLCKKVGPSEGETRIFDSREPRVLNARWTIIGDWSERVAPSAQMELSFEVLNAGDTIWLVSRAALKGTVRVGLRVVDERGAIMDEVHGVPPLPRAVAPGEKVSLKLNWQAPRAPGAYTLKLDLVDQDICWFEQRGSETLSLQFQVE